MKKDFNNLYKILLKFLKKNNILAILFLILVIMCIIYYNYNSSNSIKEGFGTELLADVKYKYDNQDNIIVKHLIPDNIAKFDKLDQNRVKIAIRRGSYEKVIGNKLSDITKLMYEKFKLFNLLPYGYFHNKYLEQEELDFLYVVDFIYYDVSNHITMIKFLEGCEVDIYDTSVRDKTKLEENECDIFTIRQNAYNVFLKCDKDSSDVLVDNIKFTELQDKHNKDEDKIIKEDNGYYRFNRDFNKVLGCRVYKICEGVDEYWSKEDKKYKSPYSLNRGNKFKTLYINDNDIIRHGKLVYTPQKIPDININITTTTTPTN